jgi:hypothetical protein
MADQNVELVQRQSYANITILVLVSFNNYVSFGMGLHFTNLAKARLYIPVEFWQNSGYSGSSSNFDGNLLMSEEDY